MGIIDWILNGVKIMMSDQKPKFKLYSKVFVKSLGMLAWVERLRASYTTLGVQMASMTLFKKMG